MAMQLSFFNSAVLTVVALLSIGNVQAEELLDSRMEAFLVENHEGRESLHAASVAEPGNVLEYHLTYTSRATKPLAMQYISVPVSPNTVYLKGSASVSATSEFQVSLDGGKTWSSGPVKRQIKDKDGKLQEVVVPESEYTNLRWHEKSDIAPGAVKQYHYRVKVL